MVISTPTISSPCAVFFPSRAFKKLLNFSLTFPVLGLKFNFFTSPFPKDGALNFIFFNFSKIFFGFVSLASSEVKFCETVATFSTFGLDCSAIGFCICCSGFISVSVFVSIFSVVGVEDCVSKFSFSE